MRFDVTDDAFREQAARWLASLDDATVHDVEAVFTISPGYYPTTLYELWRAELERRGLPMRLPKQDRRWTPRVPVSHPHDCDWRFTVDTTEHLLRHAVEPLSPGDCVAHLGTPSTFLVGCRTYSNYQHVLLERNAAMTASLVDVANPVVTIDLAVHEPPTINADAAILDPPWYLGDTLVFLAASSHLCRDGALIWLCQPTFATRPGVDDERAVLLSELVPLGLAAVETSRGAVRYQTPHFEAMSLRLAAAELVIPGTWRTGDLLTLRKVGPARHLPTITLDERWSEVRFGPFRIKLRASDAEEDLAPLTPGDVLDTVSRRAPVRQRIGFWSSGNRVFGLVHPDQIGKLVELCHSDLATMQFTFAHTLAHATQLGMSASTARRLFDVLLIELQEHRAWEERP